jgi:hypothetical protein
MQMSKNNYNVKVKNGYSFFSPLFAALLFLLLLTAGRCWWQHQIQSGASEYPHQQQIELVVVGAVRQGWADLQEPATPTHL